MREMHIGLVGTGYMGKCHALAFRNAAPVFGNMPHPILASLCDIDLAVAERKAREFGFARYCSDWRELVADPAVDVVSIATPNNTHKEIALAALSAGKHVYCEKPMAISLPDAEEMSRAAEIAPGKTLLAYNYIRNPALKHARELVRSGAIGEILYFRGACEEDYLADADAFHTWRCRKADAGSGALGDLGSHLLSMAIYLAGPIEALVANAVTTYPARPSHADSNTLETVENEDIAHALLQFSNGATGTFTCSRVSWGRKNALGFDIYGSEGAISFNQERMNEIQVFKSKNHAMGNGFETILSGPNHPPYGKFVPAAGHQLGFNDLKTIEVAEFLMALNEDTPLFPTFRDGIAIERAIAAILRSTESRQWETL